MKKLLTAADVKNLLGTGQKEICLEPGTLITPSAKDLAAEMGIILRIGTPVKEKAQSGQAAPVVCESVIKTNGISAELISQIVKEVLASMPGIALPQQIVKEEDPSGVRLVRGNTVVCDPFNTGNPRDKVGLREILNTEESPNMATGFMTLEDSSFSWDLKYEELDYIIEGTLDIIVNGKSYRGQAGDVFYIPANTTVTFSSPDKARFFFVTYPANWAELSNYQK